MIRQTSDGASTSNRKKVEEKEDEEIPQGWTKRRKGETQNIEEGND